MDILPPQDLDAEQRILGAIMVDETLLRKAELAQDDFYKEIHRKIWVSILEVSEVNVMTVTDKLRQRSELESVGGASYLSSLVSDGVFPYFNSDVEIVKDKAVRRQIMTKAMETIRNIESAEIDDLIGNMKFKLENNTEIVPAKVASAKTIRHLDRLIASDDKITGLPSGFTELDKKTGGFQNGELIIIAARPGIGKSVMKSNIAIQSGQPVGIFEMEMALEQNGLRFISSIGEVDHELIRLGKINNYEYRKVLEAAIKFADMPIYQVFKYALTVEKMRSIAERMVEKYKIKAIFIDYLQLMKASKGSNREAAVAHMSVELKGMARELNIPVIVLAQLNRECERRNPKKPIPMLSDLRESGAIEQDADMVILLYRDDYYAKINDRASSEPGVTRVIIAKARSSRTGNIKLFWKGNYMKFKNLERWHNDG